MKKQILLLTILLSMAANAFAEEAEINGLWYELVSNTKEATVIKYKNHVKYSANIVIPATVEYNGAIYSVTSIGNSAFFGCSSLTSVTIPNSVTSIGVTAFYECSGLTSVTIPNSVTSIGRQAFSGCSGLTSVSIPNGVTSIGDGVFSGCSGLTSPLYNATLFVYMPISYSGSYNIPDGIKEICGNAFRCCSSLISLTIPNSVTSIGNMAFCGCSGLTSVTIPNSVTSIGSYAFEMCSGLTSITIPSGVTSIGNDSFSGCTTLMTVKSYIKEPYNISRFSEGTYRNGTLYVPAGTKDLYIRFDGWREFLYIEEMAEEQAPNGQCATPNILFVGKKFRFECETPDAEFESYLTTEEKFTGNELPMEGREIRYALTVYATAPGYDRSEPAKVNFVIDKIDVNNDGTVDVADIATIIGRMAGK